MFAKRFAHRLKCSDISTNMYSLQIAFNYFMHRISAFTDPINNAFIHDFNNHVLSKHVSNLELELVEKYRLELHKNTHVMELIDLGAGTKFGQQRKTMGSMAKVASVSKHYGKLLYSLAGYYKPDCIIELGTAFGISTMYLALGNPQARVITVEGNPQLAEMAYKNFTVHNLNNITLINSTFENAIAQLKREISSRTLVFIDGNHTLQATLQYFELFGKVPDSNNIMVFDDINWSPDMLLAWNTITESVRNGIIVDLFQMGIIFQGRGMNRQKFRLWY